MLTKPCLLEKSCELFGVATHFFLFFLFFLKLIKKNPPSPQKVMFALIFKYLVLFSKFRYQKAIAEVKFKCFGTGLNQNKCLKDFFFLKNWQGKLSAVAEISNFSSRPARRLAQPVIIFFPLGPGTKFSSLCVFFWARAVGPLKCRTLGPTHYKTLGSHRHFTVFLGMSKIG